MLSSLSSYLVQHKKVYIPHIGTFELQYKPAVLQFADRLIYPPSTEVLFLSEGNASKEQVHYLGSLLHLDERDAEDKLRHFGAHLKRRIEDTAFEWKGFGKLALVDGAIVFESTPSNALKPVAAHKIIRENAHHDVLVGERELHSSDVSYINESTKPGRSYVDVGRLDLGLLRLHLLFITWCNMVSSSASGLQQKTFSYQQEFSTVTPSPPNPLYFSIMMDTVHYSNCPVCLSKEINPFDGKGLYGEKRSSVSGTVSQHTSVHRRTFPASHRRAILQSAEYISHSDTDK